MKIIYAGTPDFAVPPLQALLDSEHEVVAVYTQPDRPSGRGKKLTASPVKNLALEAGVSVYQPLNFKEQADCDALIALEADLMVVAAYGLILPKVVLDAPRFGCINIHASLLPRWRGAAPIQRAIEAGDRETGITIMQMAEGLDTGDMLFKSVTDISDMDTGGALHDRLAEMGAPALLQTLPGIFSETLSPEVQDEALVTYAHKLSKSDGLVDWSRSAAEIARKIRAFDPWPVCQTPSELGDLRLRGVEVDEMGSSSNMGEVMAEDKNRGMQVVCGEGTLWLKTLQLPGKRPMDARDFFNGRSLLGKVLG